MNDLVIQAMNAITKVEGVPQKGGKVYKQVKDRVEVFRRHCGFDFGIQTEILDHNDQKVIVQCKIFNSEGFQIGSGLAEEIRGKVNGRSHVNETSAIENCETSAIGRALASLGLHGGEYASINEVEKAEQTKKIIEQNKTEPSGVTPPKEPVTKQNDFGSWREWAGAKESEIDKIKSQAGTVAWANDNQEKLLRLQQIDKPLWQSIFTYWENHREKIETGETNG